MGIDVDQSQSTRTRSDDHGIRRDFDELTVCPQLHGLDVLIFSFLNFKRMSVNGYLLFIFNSGVG